MNLEVWKKAKELDTEVNKLIERLPKREQYGLVDQLGRCSGSISSNISEGYARKSTKDYVQFLAVARGSNNEVRTQLELCVGRGYLTEWDIKRAMNLSFSVYKKLTQMIASLEEKIEREEREKALEKERKKRGKQSR